MGGALKTKEEIMDHLIMAPALRSCSQAQLFALLSEINRWLATTAPGTPARRNAIASYENVQRELNRRRARHLQPVASP